MLQSLIGEVHLHVDVSLSVTERARDLQPFSFHCRQPNLKQEISEKNPKSNLSSSKGNTSLKISGFFCMWSSMLYYLQADKDQQLGACFAVAQDSRFHRIILVYSTTGYLMSANVCLLPLRHERANPELPVAALQPATRTTLCS